MRGIVPGDIRDHQGKHLGFACGGEPAPLNQRKVLAHRIHVLDRGATAQQFASSGLELVHRDGLDRQGEQGGAAAGNQHQQ